MLSVQMNRAEGGLKNSPPTHHKKTPLPFTSALVEKASPHDLHLAVALAFSVE